MMKQAIVIALVSVLGAGLAACGKQGAPEAPPGGKSNEQLERESPGWWSDRDVF